MAVRVVHPGLNLLIAAALLLSLPTSTPSATPPDHNGQASLSRQAGQRIHIDITTHLGDHQTFQEGDTISFLISLDRDAYLLVIYEDALGNLLQIVPNKRMAAQRYEAGLFITIPAPDSGFRFTVQEPFGKERLWAFASDTPSPEIPGKYLNNGLKRLKSDIPTIKRQFLEHPKSGFGEASLIIRTKGRD